MADIDDLSKFMSQGDSAPPDAAPVAQAQASGPDITELSQFMHEQNEPSTFDKVADAAKQQAESLGRGAVATGKNIVNLSALAQGHEEPFPMPPEAKLAQAEALASGVTLGLSRIAENKILNNQMEQARRAKDNADLVDFSNAIGGAGLIAATGGLGSVAEATGATGLTKVALTGALDNAALTYGNLVSDKALGDPDLNAQKIGAEIGMAALIGAPLSVGAHVIASRFLPNGMLKNTVAEAIEKNQSDLTPATLNLESPPVEIDPSSPFHAEYESAIKNTDLDQMERALAKAKAMGITTELPQKRVVVDAESRLRDLQLPLNQIQVDSLDNQGARNNLGILKQLRMEGGGTFADFETAQKAERLMATDKAIQELAPGKELASDLHEAGQNAVQHFQENYQAKQEELAPILHDIKNLETENPFGHQPGAVKAMAERVPGVTRMFDGAEIRPYSSSWGIDKSTYEAVAQAYKALEEPAFIQELMNVRNGLEQNINIQQPGKAAAQIRQLKAGMMDYIQEQIAKVEPNIRPEHDLTRNTLRDWAINEQYREIIEKEFGASLGTHDFSSLSKDPAKILDKIFKSVETVKAAKQILKPEQFNQIRANYLAAARQTMTKDGAFSSNKFKTFLDKKRLALGEAMSDPQGLNRFQRINDLNTTMRNFSDSAPANPSGTASGIKKLLEKGANGEINIGTILGHAKEVIGEKLTENAKRRAMNKALRSTSETLRKISAVKKMADAVDQKTEDGIRAILLGSEQHPRKKRKGQ